MGSLDVIESEGLAAYWDGYAGSSNPYTRKTPESRAWAMGWMKGRREEKKMFGSTCVPIEEKAPTRYAVGGSIHENKHQK